MEDLGSPPVDWAANAALFGGREEMGKKFFRRFVELTGPIMGALQDAAVRSDFAEVKRLAHQIKGGSGSVAATQVHHCAERVEAAIASGATTEAATWIEQLNDAWTQVCRYAEGGV